MKRTRFWRQNQWKLMPVWGLQKHRFEHFLKKTPIIELWRNGVGRFSRVFLSSKMFLLKFPPKVCIFLKRTPESEDKTNEHFRGRKDPWKSTYPITSDFYYWGFLEKVLKTVIFGVPKSTLVFILSVLESVNFFKLPPKARAFLKRTPDSEDKTNEN